MKPFGLGAVYILEPDYTPQEILRDLDAMKECGYNLITLWPAANPWLTKDPTEWVFTDTINLLDACHSRGMQVIVQLFGQNQAQEFMPDCALSPDMQIQDFRGPTVNANCFWANLNHPQVRTWMERYFEAAVNALKSHPALYAWDVFNEAHFRSDDSCTIQKYRQWLERKYGSIHTLNLRWHRRYSSFEQIEPALKRSAYSIWSSLLPDVDYEKFRSENLTEICRFLYDSLHRLDDTHPIMVDGTSSQILAGDVTERNNDEFDTAQIPDVYGATFYPKSWGRNYKDTPWLLAMYFSVPAWAAHKAKKPYIVNELQTHTQSVLTPGSEVSPEELYQWSLMCIFNGACALQYWRWRPFLHGYQSTGRGLTHMDGTPNARSQATKSVVSLLTQNSLSFKDSVPEKPFVKLCLGYSSRLFFDALLKWNGSFWAQEAYGWYKLFWDKGLPIGFTDPEALDDSDMNTPVLVLPSLVSVSQNAAQKLRTYVENGGVLIADARLGALDEWGTVPSGGIPGKVLSEVFGLLEKDVSSNQTCLIEGYSYSTGHMTQILETSESTRVLAALSDGAPAITAHAFGKGLALYCGFFAGQVFLEHPTEPAARLLLREIIPYTKPPMLAQKPDCIHLAYLKSQEKRTLLALNFSDEPQKVTLSGQPAASVLIRLSDDQHYQGETIVLSLKAGESALYTWEESECRNAL